MSRLDQEPVPGQNGDALQEILGGPDQVPDNPLYRECLGEFLEARQKRLALKTEAPLDEFRRRSFPRYIAKDENIVDALSDQMQLIREATLTDDEKKKTRKQPPPDAMVSHSDPDRY